MEKVLKLYTFVEGGSAIPFPHDNEQIEVSSFRYEAKRMGAAPTISCSIYHDTCLDDKWSKDVYVEFRGEKYYLKQTPTSSYSNTDVRYKHDAEFVSERSILDNVYFYDVVNEEDEIDRVVSNSTSFTFSGDIKEFVTRLNKSLSRLNVGYSIVIDNGISSEVKLVEFDNKFITDALQEIQNTYNLKYYFIDKVIHVGEQQNIIDRVFKYGANESLLSISKNNANAKIINRITGVGSSDNIPFYYPNDDEKGITTVLLNGDENIASIVDATKYRKVKSTDVFVYHSKAEYKVDALSNSKRILGSISFIGDPEEQKNGYDVDFYYQLVLTQAEDVEFSVSTDYANSKSLRYELIKTTGVHYGVHTENKTFSLTGGTYNFIVRWRFLVDEPFKFEEEAYSLVDKYVSVSANIVVSSTNVWTLNNTPINLESYGIYVASPKDKDRITIKRVSYIHPQKTLMPSIYRIEKGKERFYNAENNTYKDEKGNFYSFDNIYSSRHPREHIETFDDIKPSIKNIKNSHNQPIDEFIDFAYDEQDNDEVDENNEFIHPYFYAKLRKFNGEYGFNLFDHAIENGEMNISMTSGSCASCQFTIMVDPDTQKNKVLVDDNGHLLRDNKGNVRLGTPIDKQNDTINNEVWIALKKDIDTYGVIMPNASNKYKPSVGDKFVILNIDLPKVYITQAEKRLEQELIKFMHENNSEKFNFSISFSRIFFAENNDLLQSLNENSKLTIEYNDKQYELFVSSYLYSVDSNSSLPEVKIELSDVLAISQNQVSRIINATKSEILTKTTKDTETSNAEIKKLSAIVETEIQVIKEEIYKPRPESVSQNNNETTNSEIEKLFVIHYDDPLNPTQISWVEVKYNLGVRGGVTFYARGEDVDIPTIAEGLPFDETTIRFNKDTGQIEVIGGTGGGGSADFSNVFSLGNGNAFTSFAISEDKKTLTFLKDKTFAEKASSLAGYGITDAYTKSNINSLLQGYITEITSGMVINALGYTPYASSNPNGYITSSSLNGYATQTWVKNQGYLTQHQDLSGYQPLITSTNKLAYALISGTPTSLKNPNSLSFGSKTYDGSSARTITASDLGALTSHQTIYTLTFQSGTFSSTSFTANNAAKTIKIPTSADHIADGEIHEFFTEQKAIDALENTLKNYVNVSEDQEIEGVKNFKKGLKGTNWVIGSDSYGNPYVKFYNDWYVKCNNNTMVVGKNNAQFVINQYGHIEVAGGATINGNMLVKGGVSFYSTNGSVTPFLLDVDTVENIVSESKTQVYTANAVRLLKEELEEAKAKAFACETNLANLKEKIKTALSGISSSSTASAIGSALKKLYDNI